MRGHRRVPRPCKAEIPRPTVMKTITNKLANANKRAILRLSILIRPKGRSQVGHWSLRNNIILQHVAFRQVDFWKSAAVGYSAPYRWTSAVCSRAGGLEIASASCASRACAATFPTCCRRSRGIAVYEATQRALRNCRASSRRRGSGTCNGSLKPQQC